jgi:bifunctional non-homologous end joining protein LigD
MSVDLAANEAERQRVAQGIDDTGTLVVGPPRERLWLDGFRMAGRIECGQAQLLTRTGLDWTAKYPSALKALAAVRAKTAYLDGELCGVGEDGLPSFAATQPRPMARGVRLVFYAFDLLHLDGARVQLQSKLQ